MLSILLLIACSFVLQADEKTAPASGNSNDRTAIQQPDGLDSSNSEVDWSEPFYGLRIRVISPTWKAYHAGEPAPLIVEMQNVSDAPVRLSDFHPYSRILIEDDQKLGTKDAWLGIADRDISIFPWERSSKAIDKGKVIRWPIYLERLRLNRPATGKTVQLRVSIPRQLEEPNQLPRTLYSPPTTIELADTLPTLVDRFSSPDGDQFEKHVSGQWSKDMFVLYRERGSIFQKSRAIQIDGDGRATLLDCGTQGRTTTTLSKERLDHLAAELKESQYWQVGLENRAVSVPMPDVSSRVFCIAYGGHSYQDTFHELELPDASHPYRKLQAIMEHLIAETAPTASDQ